MSQVEQSRAEVEKLAGTIRQMEDYYNTMRNKVAVTKRCFGITLQSADPIHTALLENAMTLCAAERRRLLALLAQGDVCRR